MLFTSKDNLIIIKLVNRLILNKKRNRIMIIITQVITNLVKLSYCIKYLI